MFKMPQILIATICIQVSVLLRTDSSPQSTACSPKPMGVRKVHHDFNNSFTATYLRKGFWPCFYFVRLSYVKLIPHVWPNRYLKILTPIILPSLKRLRVKWHVESPRQTASQCGDSWASLDDFFWRPHLYRGHLTVESVFFTSMLST